MGGVGVAKPIEPKGLQVMRAGAHALIVASAIFASSTSDGHAARPMPNLVAASDAYDDGLLFANDGAFLFLQTPFQRPGNSQRLMVETDDCGILTSLKDARSMVAPSAFDEGWGEFDEDDPSIQGQILIGRWLSDHPEIAMVAQGIDKWCGDGLMLGEEVSALPAGWLEVRPKRLTTSNSRLSTSSIA